MMGSPLAFGEDPQPTEQQIAVDTPAEDARIRDAVSAIEKAPDPSAAVEAYANAPARDSVALKQAYVKRLISLGVPEMAEAQARDLVKRRPDDGMAWAVVAYMDARRGKTSDSMEDIVLAVRRAGDDPFVQRTAGQILAHYDLTGDRTKVSNAVADSVEDARKTLDKKPEFTQAYQRARDAYAEAPPATTTAPTTPGADVAPPPPPPGDNYVPPVTNVYNTYNYTQPYPYGDPYCWGYPSYAYDPWWPSTWWWGPGIIVIDRHSFLHHHGFFHDGFDHGRFDHGRFDHGRFDHDRFDHRGSTFSDGRDSRSNIGSLSSAGNAVRHDFNVRGGGSAGVQRSVSPGFSAPPSRFAPSGIRSAPPSFSGSRVGGGGPRSFGGGGGGMGGGGGRAGGGGGSGHR